MTTKPARIPWHEVVQLRDDLRTGELSLAVFAADLHDVVMQKGRRPVYEDPGAVLRAHLPDLQSVREPVKDVCVRLAGKKVTRPTASCPSTTVAARPTRSSLSDTWCTIPTGLPDLPAVREFEAHIDSQIPKARVAALCFDKIDLEKGPVETVGPDGTIRLLKRPWSILAYELAGADGLRLIHAEGKDEEREDAACRTARRGSVVKAAG